MFGNLLEHPFDDPNLTSQSRRHSRRRFHRHVATAEVVPIEEDGHHSALIGLFLEMAFVSRVNRRTCIRILGI
jgi:hypothetical protein